MGNPSKAKLTKDLITWLDKESSNRRRDYQVKAKYVFLPKYILDFQHYVASVQYRWWDLQNCVMLLGGIYYAGRFDGYHTIARKNVEKRELAPDGSWEQYLGGNESSCWAQARGAWEQEELCNQAATTCHTDVFCYSIHSIMKLHVSYSRPRISS
jgi:hypothetical protein